MKCPEIHDECKRCEAYQNGKCLLREEFLFLKWFFEEFEKENLEK